MFARLPERVGMNARQTDNRDRMTNQKGFTLVESVMVLIIIGIIGSISWPMISNALLLSDLRKGTEELVNEIEFARVHAASRNRSYLMVIQQGGASDNGRVQLHEGIGSVCSPANFLSDGLAPEPALNVKDLRFNEDLRLVGVESIEPQNLAGVGLCFKPDGRVLRVDTGGPVLPAPAGYAAGEAVVTLRLMNAKGDPTQHSRRVVIPYNGIPKVL